jgi:hypothetical protein
MTSATMHPLDRILRVLFAISLACWLLEMPASAQTNNINFSFLQQYQEAIAKVRAAAARPLGPYPISTECSWCSDHAWWGFGTCTQTTTQRWNFTVDFNWTRNQLNAVLQQAQQNAATFPASFAPTQAWIDKLPEFTKQFNADADQVLAVQKEIAGGKGPTDQQRQIVTQALQNLASILDSSSAQLQQGTSSLTASLQRQSQYRQSIAGAIAGADQSAQQQLTAIRNNAQAKAQPDCLENLVRNNFNPIKDQFSSSLQQISQAFQNLEASSRVAEKAVADLLGFVINTQTDIKSVKDMINAAQADQIGSFLQRLHLDAAKTRLATLSPPAR